MPWNMNDNAKKYIDKLGKGIVSGEVYDALSAIKVAFQCYVQDNRVFNRRWRNICEQGLAHIAAYEEKVVESTPSSSITPSAVDHCAHPKAEREEKDATLAKLKLEKHKEKAATASLARKQVLAKVIDSINRGWVRTNNEFTDMLAVLVLYFPDDFMSLRKEIKGELRVLFSVEKFLVDTKESWSSAILEVGENFSGVPIQERAVIVNRLLKQAQEDASKSKTQKDDLHKLGITRAQEALSAIAKSLPVGPEAVSVRDALAQFLEQRGDFYRKGNFLEGIGALRVGEQEDKATVKMLMATYQDNAASNDNRVQAIEALLSVHQSACEDKAVVAVCETLSGLSGAIDTQIKCFPYIRHSLKPMVAEQWMDRYNDPVQHWSRYGKHKEIAQLIGLCFEYLDTVQKHTFIHNISQLPTTIKMLPASAQDSYESKRFYILSVLVECGAVIKKMEALQSDLIKGILLPWVYEIVNIWPFDIQNIPMENIPRENEEPLRKIKDDVQYQIKVIIAAAQLMNEWAHLSTYFQKEMLLDRMDQIINIKGLWPENRNAAALQYRMCLLQLASPPEEKLDKEAATMLQNQCQTLVAALSAEPKKETQGLDEYRMFCKVNTWIKALPEKDKGTFVAALLKRVVQSKFSEEGVYAFYRCLPALSEGEQAQVVDAMITFLEYSIGKSEYAVVFTRHAILHMFSELSEILQEKQGTRIIAATMRLLNNDKVFSSAVSSICPVFKAYRKVLSPPEMMGVIQTVIQHYTNCVLSRMPDHQARHLDTKTILKEIFSLTEQLTPLQRKHVMHFSFRQVFEATSKKALDTYQVCMVGAVLKINSRNMEDAPAVEATRALKAQGSLPDTLLDIVYSYAAGPS